MPRLRNKEEIPNSEGATIEKRKLRGLQSKSRKTEPTIWIGKEGASEALVSQVESQLKTRELVKVRAHKSALQEISANEFAKNIATSTGSTLVEVMGHTFTLYKKRENKERRKSNQKATRDLN